MKLGKVVRPHQPSELHARIHPQERAQRFRRVARAELLLDPGDRHARMIDNPPRFFEAQVERRWPSRLQRIAGRHQPPHSIETKPPHRLLRDMHMPRVGRIERPAQKADALPGACCGSLRHRRHLIRAFRLTQELKQVPVRRQAQRCPAQALQRRCPHASASPNIPHAPAPLPSASTDDKALSRAEGHRPTETHDP